MDVIAKLLQVTYNKKILFDPNLFYSKTQFIGK